MDPTGDTSIGGPSSAFPPTRLSAVQGLAGADPAERARCRERIVASSWKPSYKYIRLRWQKSNEDAEDLCQAFFGLAIEKGCLEDFDPAQARFRTFFRVCLDRFPSKEAEEEFRSEARELLGDGAL